MPDVSGASAVKTGVLTYYQYAPGIPRALGFKGRTNFGKPRPQHAASMRLYVPSLRGALATKQSIFEFAAPWIASLTLAMTPVVRSFVLDSLHRVGKAAGARECAAPRMPKISHKW
jgi:hypothetical protein